MKFTEASLEKAFTDLLEHTGFPPSGQDGNHAIEVFNEKVTRQKNNCIHQNPVVEKIVAGEQDYLFSSAGNYYGLDSMLKVDCITPQVMTVGTPVFFKVQYD